MDLMTARRVKVGGDRFHPVVPDGAIYVGREAPYLQRSPFANPYSIKRYGLAESRRFFRRNVVGQGVLVAFARRDLANRDLACWCKTDAEWCHAEDWLFIAAGHDPKDLT